MPNWFGHVVMAILMFALNPLIAEKLMLTGYVVLFLYSGRYLIISVDPAKKGLPFILFPFVYQLPPTDGVLQLLLQPWLLLIGNRLLVEASPGVTDKTGYFI